MEVLGHDNVSYNYEAVTLAGFFENAKEAVTSAGATQVRLASITGTGDKVQVMSSVSAVETGWHEKPMVQAEVVPALAKNARTGTPRSGMEKGNE